MWAWLGDLSLELQDDDEEDEEEEEGMVVVTAMSAVDITVPVVEEMVANRRGCMLEKCE